MKKFTFVANFTTMLKKTTSRRNESFWMSFLFSFQDLVQVVHIHEFLHCRNLTDNG